MEEQVKKEFDRWVNLIGPYDPYTGKVTIGLHEVLQAHFLLVDFFFNKGEGLGGVGPKDVNMLHSALGRQFVQFGGHPKWTDRVDICATLMFGLIKNHPFFDANKRTAFLVSLLHLQKIGKTPTAPDVDFEDLTVAISGNKLSDYWFYGEIPDAGADKDILAISYFLKKNTRNIDLRSKLITYNELNSILKKRGLCLDNPKGNRIDVVKTHDSDGVTELAKPKRIAHIGFHGWTRQVSQKDINIIREASKLDARHGFDSQSFYNGLDDPLTLIKKYKEPLERLAFR